MAIAFYTDTDTALSKSIISSSVCTGVRFVEKKGKSAGEEIRCIQERILLTSERMHRKGAS
ncbi:susC/RagA family TonB-linked outer membrane protein [Anopheles sinensis]|uniref:SusC/RagA family TonB-linked outer membrane protein n=1 Tax=Anopheles sinensis TaxID=74873 RepID=A0A084VG37_ANOSI|nr:susC/RagA family TonB-linked outer membrane protein [Anopheles sinensis]